MMRRGAVGSRRRPRTGLSLGLATTLVAAAFGSAATAGPVANEVGPNLLTNGDFEATSTVAGSGWTASGFLAEGFDYVIDTNPAAAHSGSHAFAGGGVGAPGFISQTISTTAGESYNIHFWLADPSGFTDGTSLEVLWNGAVVYSASDIAGFGYKEVVVDPLATSATSTLSFGLRDDSFFLYVDSVSVRRLAGSGSSSSAPEPASYLLLSAGFGALGAGLRRRRAGKTGLSAAA